MALNIGDYGLIGNLATAALVGRDGSIDWLCLPRFDSAACFAALLGTPENGRWKIAPADPDARNRRRYLPGTAILETQFETAEGAVSVIDFMPITRNHDNCELVRIVRGVRGVVRMEVELVLRFGYGRVLPWVRQRDYGLSAIAGPDAVELHTPVALVGEGMRTYADFVVSEGDSVPFTLSYHPGHEQASPVRDHHETLDRTKSFWRAWIETCRIPEAPDHWREAVLRSLITLKLLTYRHTGAIVAAPTTSLPEGEGAGRNWDYRYCWLRDSALTLYALLNAGVREEAGCWREWLLRTIAGHPEQLQIVYGLHGERWLPERDIWWLPGYRANKPVRAGNAAFKQMQLDVYGELMDTLHVARAAALPVAGDAWRMQRVLLKHLEKVWRDPDHGIWEMRGGGRAFTHSKVMCWVAFDRALSSAKLFNLPAPIDEWTKTRDEIRADILQHSLHADGHFVQFYGGQALDASSLLLAQVGFVEPKDPRFLTTIEAVEQKLMLNGFVRRYATAATDDGVGGPENVFLPCNFWLADAYVLTGRIADAETLFERLLGIRNDLGLLSEEYDSNSGLLMGNFPQAFSHVGLINTAFNLASRAGPARQRASSAAPKAH